MSIATEKAIAFIRAQSLSNPGSIFLKGLENDKHIVELLANFASHQYPQYPNDFSSMDFLASKGIVSQKQRVIPGMVMPWLDEYAALKTVEFVKWVGTIKNDSPFMQALLDHQTGNITTEAFYQIYINRNKTNG